MWPAYGTVFVLGPRDSLSIAHLGYVWLGLQHTQTAPEQ